MVRKPEPAPSASDTTRVFRLVLDGNAALEELFRRANRDYLYWDRFKQLPMPEGLCAEEAWVGLQIARALNRRTTPMQDRDHRPFGYSLTEEAQRVLMVTDQQSAGRIGTSVSGLGPEVQQRYLLSQLMEEAIASSQIEGASTTRHAAKEMLRTGRPPRDKSERMILNNYRTITEMRGRKDEPLSRELLLFLQSSLTAATLKNADEVGRFRDEADDDIVVGDPLGEVVHVPPPASQLEEGLERLCVFANSEGEFIHPVIKGILLHFWLAYLHPFCDGNGRTARSLFYWYTLKHGYWIFEYVSISRVMLRRRAQYEQSFLYSEMPDRDLSYFLTFHLHAVEKALEEFWEYVERKAAEDRRLQRQLTMDSELNHRQRAVLGRALKDAQARFTIRSHQASHSIAYGTARSDLLDLEFKGYLRHLNEGRTMVFFPSSDLREILGGTDERMTGA
jgi:Fic family protein